MTAGSPSTPATVALERAGVAYTPHVYEHHETATNFGEEAAAALGVTVVSVALLVAHVLTLVLGLTGGRPLRADRAPVDLATRIAWSHPDADGHARPRAPGALHQA